MIGWDFDTRIRLTPTAGDPDIPDELGAFLSWLVTHRPGLEIYVLRWNVGAFTAVLRGMAPPFLQDLFTHRRLHYRIDAAHPVAAAHHQKIAVIDDTLAFCGGIDITIDRWDTSAHRPQDPHRVEPSGEEYDPWHDVTLALDGSAARAIAEVAYERWAAATGERLAPLPAGTDAIWPSDLTPDFTGRQVAVARTMPEYDDRPEVDEIRRLYLAAIAAARHTIYVESQYLAARRIAEALADRLRETDGPDIVLVLPRHADGQIERQAMDGARHELLRLLWRADVHNRFRAYYPVTSAGSPIYVHAKVLIADDDLLRIGSSNLNNRSLGFDTECDVAIDALLPDNDDADVRATISAFRTRLLAEHLDVGPGALDSAIAERGSLVTAIDSLRGAGKTLSEFTREKTDDESSALAENALVDPEKADPPRLDRIYRYLLRPRRRRPAHD